jgi:hypothetical protein
MGGEDSKVGARLLWVGGVNKGEGGIVRQKRVLSGRRKIARIALNDRVIVLLTKLQNYILTLSSESI